MSIGGGLGRGLLVLGLSLLLSCSYTQGDDNGASCRANADCTGASACVDGTCTDDEAKCASIGAFADITEKTFDGQIDEMHVAVDPGGAVHYCYLGSNGVFYGRQTDANAFEEKELVADGKQVRCGAVTVGSDGRGIVFSRAPGAVLFEEDSGWKAIELEGLELSEAGAALINEMTLIALTPDDNGGVYVALSLGFELQSQPVYIAHATREGIDVLVNGWSEDGAYSATGHAPQVVNIDGPEEWGTPLVLMGELTGQFNVELTNASLSTIDQLEGWLPRAAVGPDGVGYALYLDRQYTLRLARIDADLESASVFEALAILGELDFDEATGQIPWDLAVDETGAAHVLYEDVTQGQGAVLYLRVNPDGSQTAPILIAADLADLPGMQRYALATDICGRATVAAVESGGAGLKLKVMEGR